jgi:hypothetical protein
MSTDSQIQQQQPSIAGPVMSASPPLLIWFVLVDSATGEPHRGTSAAKVSVVSSADVDDFRKAVKAEYADSHLKGVAPSDLLVYKNKDAFDKRKNAADDERKEEPLEEDSLVEGLGTSKKDALIIN